jgi:hypothetical protein
MTMLSETMRLELAPLNVRVITLVAGGTKSKISDNGPPPESLPPASPYLAVEKHIATKMDFKQMPTEIFAEQVVDDVVRGTTGKVWHGVGSKTVRYAVPLMPQWIFVSSSWKLLTQRALMLFRTRSCLHMDEDCSTCRIRRSRHISERQCLRTYDQDSGGKSESDASRVLVHVLRLCALRRIYCSFTCSLRATRTTCSAPHTSPVNIYAHDGDEWQSECHWPARTTRR